MNKLEKAILEIWVKNIGTAIGMILLVLTLGLYIYDTGLSNVVARNLLIVIGGILLLKLRPRW